MERQPTPLKRAFFESGKTQVSVARKIGKDPADLSRIVNGMHCADDTKAAIARELGETVEALWPPAERAAA